VRASPEVVIVYAGVVTALLAVGFKLPALLRHREDASLRAFSATLLLIALSLVVVSPPARPLFDKLTGVPNLGQLVGNLLAVGAGWAGLTFLAALSSEPTEAADRRAFALVSLATAAGMGLLFLVGPARPEVPDYWAGYGHLPVVWLYRGLFLVFGGFVLASVFRLTPRYAERARRPSLRLGLRVVAAGAVAGMVWISIELARAVGRALGLGQPPDPVLALDRLLIVVTVALIALGSTLPSWSHRVGLDGALSWWREYLALQRLHPLWDSLRRAAPGVSLFEEDRGLLDRLDPRDVHFRLYRQVVEIRDALLLLNGGHPASGQSGSEPVDFQSELKDLERLAAQRAR
jgi:hypothetical protein